MIHGLALIAAVASTVSWSAVPVADSELATMRGGILLPNGLNIAIGIDIQTRVNGVLALHTIYSTEVPNNAIRVYTDGTTAPASAPGTTTIATGGNSSPGIDASRSPTGTTVTAASGGQPMIVNVLVGPTSTWLDAAGQTNVPVTANGSAVPASSGAITLVEDGAGARVTLSAPGLQVQHLVGQATGAVIANTADNRSIDTVSSINVNLVGVPAALLGGALMINRLAAETASRR